MKVHLVDGTYELFRAFYGAPSALARDGQEVGATLGFGRSMLSLLSAPDVTHVAVAFDHVIESFRNCLFSGYKTGDGVDPRLLAQFGLAEEMTRALGMVTWPMVEFEADDALATAAVRYAALEEVSQVVLCSPDKDLTQCVLGERVICLDRMRRKTLDASGVRGKFGVAPRSIPDYLALVGDSADGIPGIPRWGAKSAAAILAAYGKIEAIPPTAEQWIIALRGAPALAESLAQMREQALLYKRLATLRTDAPIRETVDELQWRGPARHHLHDLTSRLADTELISRADRLVRAE